MYAKKCASIKIGEYAWDFVIDHHVLPGHTPYFCHVWSLICCCLDAKRKERTKKCTCGQSWWFLGPLLSTEYSGDSQNVMLFWLSVHSYSVAKTLDPRTRKSSYGRCHSPDINIQTVVVLDVQFSCLVPESSEEFFKKKNIVYTLYDI